MPGFLRPLFNDKQVAELFDAKRAVFRCGKIAEWRDTERSNFDLCALLLGVLVAKGGFSINHQFVTCHL